MRLPPVLAVTTALTLPLASLPSPDSSGIRVGPLNLRAYGLMIALGVLAAVWLADRRWVARGGQKGDFVAVAVWAVPAGVIGARLYHVITDWQLFRDDPLRAVRIWEGGLGIPGGVLLGTVVGVLVARHRGMALGPGLDAAAPAIPLAQAIGRWGNWFNQELFGRPTDLPWALEIAPNRRPPGYEAFTTFHPTFLYESLWNLGVVGVLLFVDRKKWLPTGTLFALYVALYAAGRLWIEGLRIDPANTLGGLRVNEWVSIVLLVGSVAVIVGMVVRDRRRRAPANPDPAVVGAALARASAASPGATVEAGSGPDGGSGGGALRVERPDPGPAPTPEDEGEAGDGAGEGSGAGGDPPAT